MLLRLIWLFGLIHALRPGWQLIDMECIDLLKQTGSFLVPTLVTYDRIKRGGEASGMPQDQVAKVSRLLHPFMDHLHLTIELFYFKLTHHRILLL